MAETSGILIVDDDTHIREVVSFALRNAGYSTMEAADGLQALNRCKESIPDLIVLDIVMPEMDGIEVCKTLRSESPVPIIFLSSRDEEVDRIIGLELGGDDYMTKPFSPRELVARVKAVLRRVEERRAEVKSSPEENRTSGILRHGLLTVDPDLFRACWNDREVVLTVTEFGIIRTLLGFPGKAFTRDELMNGAYGRDTFVTDRTIDSHVRRIRRKFAEVGGDPVETVHGLGYRLGPCC